MVVNQVLEQPLKEQEVLVVEELVENLPLMLELMEQIILAAVVVELVEVILV